jgi:hypothetical protein
MIVNTDSCAAVTRLGHALDDAYVVAMTSGYWQPGTEGSAAWMKDDDVRIDLDHLAAARLAEILEAHNRREHT